MSEKPLDLIPSMVAFFEMVEISQALAISGLVEQWFTPDQARHEFARLHKERFARPDPPGEGERLMRVGIWRSGR